jgi:glycosyltransferase involved in cell wall biosynthesis
MSGNMEISVVICTFNRAESLKRTLTSIGSMQIPEDLSWELIVVDNNSPDSTEAVIAAFALESGLPVVYAFEAKKGLSHARNRGIMEARGAVIAFTDDDVIVDAAWLGNILNAFKDQSTACAGGRILPVWEKEPPGWLTTDLYNYLALLDLGDEPVLMTTPNLWGANFAVRSGMFEKYGNFNTEIGRTRSKLYAGEETEIIRRLIENREKVCYFPGMLVHHCISENRMNKAYFRKWEYDQGELRGMQIGKQPLLQSAKLLASVARNIVKAAGRFLWFRVTSPSLAFREQLRSIRNIGIIAGRIKQQGQL